MNGIDFKWWNTRNNTIHNPSIAETMIPNFSNMAGSAQATAMGNYQNSNLGIQAGVNGQQSPLQGAFFNPPTTHANGTMTRGGLNFDGISAIGNTLGSLGMLWNSFQQRKLAKEAFNFQKEFAQKNLQNQTDAYNTSLEDRAYARYHQQGSTRDAADEYIADHRLT